MYARAVLVRRAEREVSSHWLHEATAQHFHLLHHILLPEAFCLKGCAKGYNVGLETDKVVHALGSSCHCIFMHTNSGRSARRLVFSVHEEVENEALRWSLYERVGVASEGSRDLLAH
jgi:hypothetical protein